jgi:hypothetical protein
VRRLRQPACRALAQLHAGELSRDHLARQEVVADEVAETPADPILPLRHDRRVRDRDPERMAEQRGDGEPIGEPTDHRRLRRRAHQPHPERREVRPEMDQHRDDHEQHREPRQQPRRTTAHDGVLADLLGVILYDEHLGKLEGGGRRGTAVLGTLYH